jgi:hypothetical protein
VENPLMVAIKKGGVHFRKSSPSPTPKYEFSSHHYTFGKFCKSPTHSEKQTKPRESQNCRKQRESLRNCKGKIGN